MPLAPVHGPASPSYPPRRPRRRAEALARWARRLGTAATTAALLGSAGCYGLSPYRDGPETEEEPGEPDEEPEGTDAAPPGRSLPRLDPLPAPEPGPEPDVCEAEYRLSGMMAPPSFFSCEPAPEASFEAPLYLGGGQTCLGEPSFARFVVVEAGRYRVTLLPGSPGVLLAVIDPRGSVAAEVGPDLECVELWLAVGSWTLRTTPTEATERPGWFEFSVDALEGED